MRPQTNSSSKNSLRVSRFDLVVRDGKTGFVFFNIEGNLYDYDAAAHLLSIKGGRLLISEELANKLGRPADAGVIVGEISIAATDVSDRNHHSRQRCSQVVDTAPATRPHSERSGRFCAGA